MWDYGVNFVSFPSQNNIDYAEGAIYCQQSLRSILT